MFQRCYFYLKFVNSLEICVIQTYVHIVPVVPEGCSLGKLMNACVMMLQVISNLLWAPREPWQPLEFIAGSFRCALYLHFRLSFVILLFECRQTSEYKRSVLPGSHRDPLGVLQTASWDVFGRILASCHIGIHWFTQVQTEADGKLAGVRARAR